MNPTVPTPRRGRAARVACPALVCAALAAPALAATDPPLRGESGAACERAVQEQLRAGEVSFTAAPQLQQSLSNESQVVLRGAGRRGAASAGRTFTYSCNVDARSGDVIGVVVRETAPPVARAKPAPPPAEPDLSQLSPEACESRAVMALKQRWPLAREISFDPRTRVLKQESATRAELRGRGRALLTPGAPSALFGYDCVIDPQDGQVLDTRISG